MSTFNLLEFNEPETLADFLWRGSASASGSVEKTVRNFRFLALTSQVHATLTDVPVSIDL